MTKIYFITTNEYKFKQISEYFSQAGITIEMLREETPEIQSDNNSDVASFSAEWAANKYNKTIIKEDIGLYISALNGFPGPFLSYIEKWIKADGMLSLLKESTNRLAHWEYAVACCLPGKDPVSFSTKQSGKIKTIKSGTSGWEADKIFIPEGEKLTIAELLDKGIYERNNNHYLKLTEYLKKQL